MSAEDTPQQSRRSRSSITKVERTERVEDPSPPPYSVQADPPNPPTKRRGGKKKIMFWVVLIIVLALVGIAGYSSYQLSKIKGDIAKANDPEYQKQFVEKQSKLITEEVAKIMELPDGTPQIATVSDADTLKKNQPFFEKAQNGDQVLIYPNEAILYRPSTHKIINVAPVNRDQPKTTPAETPVVTQPATKTTTEPVSTSTKAKIIKK